MASHYTIPCKCTNCNAKFDAKIQKGQPYRDGQVCPVCECARGTRINKSPQVLPVEIAEKWPAYPRRNRKWDYYCGHTT